jgi:hypothetical protein
MKRAIHFVGFRDDRYWNAVKVWGPPDFVHAGWDMRARREIADGDTVIFADGPADQEPRAKSFSDLREASPDAD